MKFVRTTALVWGRVAGLSVLGLLVMAGCIGGPSSEEELATFQEAGPVQLQVDLAQLLKKRMSSGPYRLIPGDILKLQMPAVTGHMPGKTVADAETESYLCRVDANGNVILPIVGEVPVAGRTLSEIEVIITDLYYPKYFFQKPSIVASVDEYQVISVSVVGALEEPGVYELRSNEKTLISALMKAGGITEDGATAIYIHHAGQDKSEAVVIPVVGLNIPARDVDLADGDTIVVESSEPQVITVIGLVNKPGLFPWSTKNRYNVMDALAFAGGINDVADPQHVTVYRQDSNGKVVSAVLKLDGASAVGASNIDLKPGDVIAVEQTLRTRTRLLLAAIVRIGVGANAGASVGPN